MDAGRIALARLDALESQRKSFAFEATLASQGLARRLERLEGRGYLGAHRVSLAAGQWSWRWRELPSA